MALNTSPSFMSGKSASGDSLSSRISGQRAATRRRSPGGMAPSPGGMRPSPASSMAGAGVANRMGQSSASMRPTFGNGGFGFGFNGAANAPNPMSFGYNPTGAGNKMGGPPPMSPMRMQADPLRAAPPEPMTGDGMVAATAPPPDFSGLQQKMGANTGFTGGMTRRPGMFSMA